ncbi:unnamed protein product [Miscanthus lutarioriparius]|uniref:Uncharacterized protein n=1 Tax=Miscanthus lutarioriparius TaxID=422564 RepID=A0A811PY01_9POAL|nr:unnamed protein product [Miscanthus lutarioriparius]
MAAETETETETSPLVGVVPAPDAKAPRAAASLDVEARIRAMRAAAAEEREKMLLPRPRPATGPFSRLARLWRRFFVRFDPDSIPVCHPLDDEQLEMLERHKTPGYFKRLAMDRQLVTECLQHYNSMHSMNQLLKPTVSWVSLFGGLHVGLAYLIPFARHATVALMFHVLACRRCLRVDITMWGKSVKCAIVAPMCCIHTQENLRLAIMILTTPTEC